MSTHQPHPTHPDADEERSTGATPPSFTWNAPTCTACGAAVTRDFARVFGDNDDVVHGCPSCMTFTQIQRGRTAGQPTR